jgi:UDP:flavonoid glycosyltransferase YjiC (YdhE family)
MWPELSDKIRGVNVLLITLGSRGDVQPYVALGLGLQAAGHEVTIGTHATFEMFVRRHGLNFAELGGDVLESVNSKEARAWMESGDDPRRFVQGFLALMAIQLPGITQQAWEAAKSADAIIGSGTGMYSGQAVAEARGVPFMPAFLQPVHPTGEFPSALFPIAIKGGVVLNWATHCIGGMAFWKGLHPIVNQIRREQFGLPAISPFLGPVVEMDRKRIPVLYGFSQSVLRKPTNWTQLHHVTGYWFLDEPDWHPPAKLMEFLEDGPPPVCVGFGSMSDSAPDRMTEIVVSALKKSGQRGLLLSGWGGLTQSDLSDDFLLLSEAPHSWLFPRVRVIVHHGGAGTTSAGVRSGQPAVVVPFFGDQPFWADRLHDLGVSPAPIPRRTLTADLLAQAINRAVEDEQMRTRANALGEAVRSERGSAQAAKIFDSYCGVRT